jgi:murein DD-endopeptidase MepM/ murein hydrolase activator NlpD
MSYSRYFQAVPELWRLLQDRYPSLIQMKPLLVLVTAIASGTSLSVLSQHPGFADAGHVQAPFLLASAPATQSRLWVKVSTRSTLQDIAADLGLSNSDLTALNDQASQDTIKPGAWIVIPADAEESLASATRLDGTTVLRKAPLQTPPAPQSVVRIKANESLSTFSRDQGVSLSELRSLNPGLDLARLAIGSEVRVAKASPRALLAIRPTVSGGASFPALPALPGAEGESVKNQSFIWPTKGVFTSGFGWRWGRMHKGIDIANNVGTPIVAAKDGVVKFSGWSSGYGYLVELAHADGSSTRYAHNSRLLVRKGQMIPQGVKISLMGSTGRSTGPHLHFEIRQRGGSALDPMPKLPARRRA